MNNRRFLTFMSLSLLLGLRAGWAQGPLTLEEALFQAFSRNPSIAASEDRARAEAAAVSSSYSLPNPKIGFMRENNVNFIQTQMGPMDSWMVSQEVLFPAKYFMMGSAQEQRARGAKEEVSQKRLEVRQEVISTYYNLYSASRVLALLKAQKETLREIARIAEARRATGAVPQQDEMKAHVEQTRIEIELIIQEQQIGVLESKLNGLMNRQVTNQIEFPKQDILVPELNVDLENIQDLTTQNSRVLAVSRFSLEEANQRRQLASWGYAPDLMLEFRKPFRNAPDGAYEFKVELGVPLWFLTKQSSEVSEARARAAEAERNLEKARVSTAAEARGLATKVKSYTKLLKIYQTALIPQATSTLNSSRAAYSAGKTGFLELLDSERSLYQVQISYFRMLSEYVENLATLEKVVGASLSTLPNVKDAKP